MGDGSSIKFWHDPWFRGLSLKDNFAELYSIACNRDASVAELLALSWPSKFNRQAQICSDLGHDPSLSHVWYLVGTKCSYFQSK